MGKIMIIAGILTGVVATVMVMVFRKNPLKYVDTISQDLPIEQTKPQGNDLLKEKSAGQTEKKSEPAKNNDIYDGKTELLSGNEKTELLSRTESEKPQDVSEKDVAMELISKVNEKTSSEDEKSELIQKEIQISAQSSNKGSGKAELLHVKPDEDNPQGDSNTELVFMKGKKEENHTMNPSEADERTDMLKKNDEQTMMLYGKKQGEGQ